MKSRLTLPVLVVLAIAAFGLWLQGAVPDVPTGQWLAGPSVAQPREGAVSVALDDGRVLLIGGRTAGGPVATVEVVDENGSISLASPMALARVGHTAVRLSDGSVLVAGGSTVVATEQGTAEVPTASAEIFAPAANVWFPANPLNAARTGHTATALADGRVLVAGGTGEQGALDSMEVFEPLEMAFRVAGLLSSARAEHAAALAGKTQVIVVGGRNADGVLNTADLVDVESGTVSQVTLTMPRAGASATTLLDGTVLVAGGTDGANELASAEIIDARSGTTTGVASMAQPRRDHQAIRLDRNNTVLIVGGTSNGAVASTAEQYVPWTEQFLVTGSPAAARTATALSNLSTEGVALLAAGKAGNGAPVAATESYGFATVKTDKGDYAPGEFVTITGSGWQPGETVNLVLHEVNTGAPDMPLIATADAQGNIFNDVFAPNEQDDGVRFYLTATGAGSTAQMTFTDAKPNAITVGLQSPSPIAPGGSSTFAITVGFNGNAQSCTASLSVSTVLPSGAVASFSPSSVTSTGANQTSTLTITTTGATPPGLTSFTVRAAGVTSPACNADIATGSGSLLVVEPTTTTLGSAPNPSAFGQSVTLTATVTQTVGPTTPNAGNVTFKDGATTLGLVAVNASGVATLSTSALTVAGNPHNLTASYAGATAFGASSSNTVSQVVNKASTTTTVARTAGPNPSVFGQSLTFTATVTPVAPGGGTRTGIVTFMDGAATIGTGAVNASGVATLTTTTFAVGAHSITAVYGGDGNFTSSTSSALSHTVNQAGTTTTITSDLPDPSVVGQPVTVNFTVVSGGGTPTGNVTVTVNDASGNTCSGTVAAGTCSLTLTAAGSKTLTATYASDTNFTGSASSGTPHAVNKANTTTTVTSDLPDPSLVGESVTVNYTVTATAPGAGTPTGNVTVSAGADNCTGTVAAGTCDITFASSGAKTLTANFSGDPNYNTSTSAGVAHTVNQVPSITSASSTTFTVGAAGSFTVTATGFPAPTFGATGALPSGVTFNTTTGVLSGTPGPNTGGAYPVTITASNGVLPNASQSFTLTVNQAPSITSANSTSFVVNTVGSFTVTATGFPVPTLSQSGPLPAGVTFAPGTGLLSGTPTVSGSFPINFTASNGVGSNATQSFTLTVGQPPTITSADNTSFTVNTAASFTVTATGFPAPTFTNTGTLPTGVTLSSAGVLSGTPALGAVGTYPIAITAANGVGSNATQNFTLTVNKGTVTFSSLSTSSVITYGTPTISVSGRIDGATMLPGTVTVTMDGVSAGPLSLGGNPNNFNGTLSTAAIAASAVPYIITYTYSGDANFNGTTDTSTSLTVNKATPAVAVSFGASPIAYDGASHAATVTVTGVSGPLTVPANGTTAIAYLKSGSPSGTPTDAGSYTASATFASTNPNYNDASSTVNATLTINKATPTVAVSFVASPIPYDGASHAATVTVTGVSGPLAVPGDGTTAITYLKSGSPSGTPTDAGSYTASATFTATNVNYNDASSSVSAALTIDKASSTTIVTFADGPTTSYSGDPHPATATVTGAGGLNESVAVTYTPGPAAPVNAGSYSADAIFAGDANHDPSTGSAALTVTKVDPTVTATGNTCTYDGNPCAGSGTATGVKGESLTPVNVAYKDGVGTLLTSAPVNAGTYSVAARFVGDTNYNGKQSASATLTINKASSTTTVTFADGPTTPYTGDPHPATATVTGAGGLSESVPVTYTPGPGAPVNAGSYSADASFAGDANHDPSTGSAALTVTKVDPTVTATGNTCTYDGNPCAGSGTATGVKGESLTPVNVAYKDGVGTLLTSAPVNAGTYSVAARFAGDTNYNGKQSASATLTINKASSTTTVTFADGPTTPYTGDPHPATATVTGAGGLSESVAVTYTPGPGAPANAGSYSADASFAGDANHDPSTGSAALTVTKVDPTVTATGNTCTYDGNSCAGSGTATGVKGESLTPVNVAYKDGVGTLLTSAPVNAGTYSVAGRFAGDTNYNGKQSASATLTINKASSTTTVTFADGPTTPYTGDPHPATATVTGAGGLNESVAVTYTPGPGAPVNAGSYSADASFAGDANHEASSGSTSLTIAKADTTTTIASDTPDPSVPGQSVMISYAVAPIAPGAGTPTGSIIINSGADSCTAIVAAGQCSITFTTAGPHPLTASYAGDSNFNGSTSASEPHTVNKANTTAAITSDTPDPSVVGQGVVVNFNVTVNAPGAGSPTGNVTVSDGTDSCIGTVAAGTCMVTFTTAGAKSLTATYSGDSNFNGNTSSPVTPHQVNKADTIAGITSDTPDPSLVGEIVTIKYNVAVTAPGAGTPAGNVTVSDGTQSCTGTVAAGQCTIAFSTAGAHPVTATYAGDANFNDSVSAAEPHQVNKANTTSTVTSDTPDPSVTGQPVTISYTVAVNAPGAGTATGNVTISDGTQSCTDTVAAGSCSITFTSAGPRTLVATYAGDSNFNGSTSVSAAHAVNKANTQTAVTSSPNPSLLNQPVTFTATVTAVAPGAGTRTGTVTFKDGATTLGTGAVNASGHATLTTSSLAAGSHTITAIYGGDGNFNTSTGTTSAPQVVNYTFTGFFSPVDNMPTINSAKAGSAIPTKWRIVDTAGVGVSDPGSFTSFTSYAVSCGAWATAITDPVPEDFSGNSGLLYQGNGNWQWNWKTPKEYAGQCRVARVTLRDGTTHEYDVKFK